MEEKTMKVYANPGTSNWVRCFSFDVPNGYIEMTGMPPLQGNGSYIASETGEWVIPDDQPIEAYNYNVKIQREQAYLETASIKDQLEAIVEAQMGKPEKLNELCIKFQAIRDKYPKK